jgi:hypothetical protein
MGIFFQFEVEFACNVVFGPSDPQCRTVAFRPALAIGGTSDSLADDAEADRQFATPRRSFLDWVLTLAVQVFTAVERPLDLRLA